MRRYQYDPRVLSLDTWLGSIRSAKRRVQDSFLCGVHRWVVPVLIKYVTEDLQPPCRVDEMATKAVRQRALYFVSARIHHIFLGLKNFCGSFRTVSKSPVAACAGLPVHFPAGALSVLHTFAFQTSDDDSAVEFRRTVYHLFALVICNQIRSFPTRRCKSQCSQHYQTTQGLRLLC